MLDHMAVLILVSRGPSIPFSIVAISTYIPTNSIGGSLLFPPSPAFIVCRLFGDGHFGWCEVGSHCINSFDLHFSNN